MAQSQMRMTLANLAKYHGVFQLFRSSPCMRASFAARPSYSSSSDNSAPPEGAGFGNDDSASKYQSRVVQFSSSRSRDYMGEAERLRNDDDTSGAGQQPRMDATAGSGTSGDSHIDSYDGHGTISLSSHMQTNVPEPFTASGSKASPSHVNMPGGHDMQGHKYLSDERQQAHYGRQQQVPVGTGGGTKQFSTWAVGRGTSMVVRPLHGSYTSPALTLPVYRYGHRPSIANCIPEVNLVSWFHSSSVVRSLSGSEGGGGDGKDGQTPSAPAPVGQRARLKQAFRDYGATVVVFHVSISLASLGVAYLAVSSGLDVAGLLAKLPIDEEMVRSKLAAGVGTFALAYAVHKVFAPARIAVTLTCTPFIVHYLRRVGFLRPPKK